MMTVVDQVSPWLMPSSTLAATTQLQAGAQISSSGAGRATSHPATRTGLRPYRSDRVPAKKLVTALTAPAVPTGMKAGVSTAPCGVVSFPTRASPSVRSRTCGCTSKHSRSSTTPTV